MKVADVSCQTVGGLLSRWYDGTLAEVEADVYEQHMLVCPPCQRQNDKLRVALAAIPAVADVRPGAELVTELLRYAREHGSAGVW
ncbi:MAG: zf-HC2 domain-containing protein [Actinobacteria bacterium]|nr:MAG: zf-HC2 domain-containing protein [Actinomycetota bacterium]